jgi:hypothetical protein
VPERWDFEGRLRFLSPEEGGRRSLPKMGYFPEFAYPDEKGKAYIARPVAAFREDGTPYEADETFEATIVARFDVLSRDLFERVHRPRLAPGLRFDLTEGGRVVAHGTVTALNGP